MIKNIRAHKTFLLFAFLGNVSYIQPVTVVVKELSDTEIASLRNYQKQYPNGFTIQVNPNQTVMNKLVGWGEWITGTVPTTNTETTGWLSIKPLVQWAFGTTVVSYCATAYVIYRAYHLLKKIGTWTNWLGKESDDEIILYVRRNAQEHSSVCLSSIKDEIALLDRYIFVHNKLQELHLRWLFPQNKAYDECIVERVERLKALERKLRIF